MEVGDVVGVKEMDCRLFLIGVPGGTRLRQAASLDSRAPTFLSKSETMFRAEVRVEEFMMEGLRTPMTSFPLVVDGLRTPMTSFPLVAEHR